MKINKLATASLLIASSLGITANAQIQNVEYSPISGVITARGTIADDGTVFLTALKDGSGELLDNIVFQKSLSAVDGAYKQKFKVPARLMGVAPQDSVYKITVKESAGEENSDYSFALAQADIIEEFKTKAENERLAFMRDNRYKLGLYLNGIDDEPRYSAILNMMVPADFSKDADALCKTMQTYMMYDYIQNGKIENLFTFRMLLDVDDMSSMQQVFTPATFDEVNEKDATSRLNGKTFKTAAQFEKALNEACVLSVVKNSNGFGNVQNAMVYFAGEIGINPALGSQKIYSQLQNKDFSDYSGLRRAFNALVAEDSKPNNSGNNSTPSGGGGISIIPQNPGSIVKPENVTDESVKDFNDLAGYDWAKEAINYLANKSIVSGKEIGKYYPGESITRSEFVKIIVNAFNIKDGSADLKFKDVDESRWDYKFINAAYSAGLIDGFSDEYFGCDVPISRQDIAVIITRVKNFEGGVLAERFADDRQIAEYAYDSVYNLRFKGVLNGDDYNCFNPTNNATRAETALIVYSVIK